MKVVFIAGAGRSGSTLLARLLARLDGVTTLGEVTHLWERGILEDQLCGCGQPFGACDHWRRVLAEAFGKAFPYPADEMARLRRLAVAPVGMTRFVPGVPERLIPGGTARRRARSEYRDILARVYRAGGRIAGAGAVVDSTKYPSEAYLLAEMAGGDIEPCIVHLVRDSHAVVHAWQKRKRRPEIHWRREEMPRYPWWKTATAWTVFNAAIERLASRPGVVYHRVRYEDLIGDPTTTLARLAARLGLPAGAAVGPDGHPSFLDPGGGTTRVHMAVDHTVSGNPSRFETGWVELRADRTWEDGAGPVQRAGVSFLTGWHRRRYGYGGGAEP